MVSGIKTSFRSVAAAGLEGFTDVVNGGSVEESEVVNNLINAIQSQMCFGEAWSLAELIRPRHRNVQVSV